MVASRGAAPCRLGTSLTLPGDATVGGNVLATALVQGGDLNITNAGSIGGDLRVSGRVTAASLSTSGASTVGGNLTALGTVTMYGGNFFGCRLYPSDAGDE